MTPEAQRIAIAGVHLGLIPIDGEKASACGHFIMLTSDGSNTAFCPDYLKDLNAMHEAESWLLDNQADLRPVYRRLLIDASEKSHHYWRATAAQRAEAFLRTLNLWTDD